MKTRHGFVSNSSSSSFVTLGVAKQLTWEEREELEKRFCVHSFDSPDGNCLVGERLAEGETYMSDNDFTIQELNEKAIKLAEQLGVDVFDVRIYMGTYPC